MCSLNPDIDDDEVLMPAVVPIKKFTPCRKCKDVESVVVLQSKFSYCKACFIELVSHKFFGCLGKSKMMKPTDRVLILCSGSQSSSVLLNLIKIGLHERQKKILTEAVVLFIDTRPFIPLSTVEMVNLIKEIKEMISHFDFKSFYSQLMYSKDSLKDMNDLSWLTEEYLQLSDSQTAFVDEMTSTAKEDLLVKLRSETAANVARELGCNKIFVADTNDHIAARILSNVALGRGEQLSFDIGFCDNRFEDISILRPLRECSRKEIAFYRLLFNLPCVSYQKESTMKKGDDSIQKLTEKFVAELQVSFPSTVSMIVGTGNKLAFKQDSAINSQICILCKSKMIESKEDELCAVSATRISHLISTVGQSGFNPESFTLIKKNKTGTNCGKELCNCSHQSSKSNIASFDSIKDAFCYGCQLILKDMKHIEKMPAEILENAYKTVKLNEMKEEINDFLL